MTPRIVAESRANRQIYFLILISSWLLIGILDRNQLGRDLYLSWGLLTSLFSLIFLCFIGYFEDYTPKPELIGMLILFLTLSLSSLCSIACLMLVAGASLSPSPELFKVSAGVTFAFMLTQWAMYKTTHVTRKYRALATCLLPEEANTLHEQIHEAGLSNWIKIHRCESSDNFKTALPLDETVVISRGATRHLEQHPEILLAHLRGQKIVDVRQVMKEIHGRVDLENTDAWTFFLMSRYQSFPIRLVFYLKSFVEPLIALLLLILLSPLWGLIALGVYFTSGYPILYRQERLGYKGKRFFLLKFRSMPVTSESTGPQWASKEDPRVTPLGRWLRKTRLDEIPQLINVLRDELSLVGPRPERPEFYQVLNKQIPLFPMRLSVRPGITGWAQVKQGYAGSIKECKTKLEYDLYYIQNMSPRLDFRVMVNTLILMLRGNSGR
ncbi:MAG: sugar transferase [Elusimicrobiota bacterium]|jgi:lipopolysaccharide/colanic/teichoic acid biosynthesis glycosyltransferase